MKSVDGRQEIVCGNVAPFVGAWIEINCRWVDMKTQAVAPFVGAWIEIM